MNRSDKQESETNRSDKQELEANQSDKQEPEANRRDKYRQKRICQTGTGNAVKSKQQGIVQEEEELWNAAGRI